MILCFAFNDSTVVCVFLQFTHTFALKVDKLQYYIEGVWPKDYNITLRGGLPRPPKVIT